MLRLLIVAPSIFEVCLILYAAFRVQQFLLVWGLLLLFTATKFALKYVYLLHRSVEHEKYD